MNMMSSKTQIFIVILVENVHLEISILEVKLEIEYFGKRSLYSLLCFIIMQSATTVYISSIIIVKCLNIYFMVDVVN